MRGLRSDQSDCLLPRVPRVIITYVVVERGILNSDVTPTAPLRLSDGAAMSL